MNTAFRETCTFLGMPPRAALKHPRFNQFLNEGVDFDDEFNEGERFTAIMEVEDVSGAFIATLKVGQDLVAIDLTDGT